MSFVRMAQRRVVLSYGIFDRFTQVHAARLQSLSQLGSELIIGCATDDYCAALGLRPRMNFNKRREMVESCRFVSRVIAQETMEQNRTDIVNYNVGLFVMASEWAGKFDDLQDVAQIYYLPQTAQKTQLVTVDQLKLSGAM